MNPYSKVYANREKSPIKNKNFHIRFFLRAGGFFPDTTLSSVALLARDEKLGILFGKAATLSVLPVRDDGGSLRCPDDGTPRLLCPGDRVAMLLDASS